MFCPRVLRISVELLGIDPILASGVIRTWLSLFHTQYSFYSALYLTREKNSVASRDEKRECDRQLEGLARGEASNVEQLIALLESDPNPHMAHFAPFAGDWKKTDEPLNRVEFGLDPFIEADLVDIALLECDCFGHGSFTKDDRSPSP